MDEIQFDILDTWPDWGKKYCTFLSRCQILKLHLWEVHLCRCFLFWLKRPKMPASHIVVAYSVGLLIRRTNVTKTSTGRPPHSHKLLAQRVLIVAAETWFLLTGRFVCVCVCTAVFITRTYSWAHYNNIRYYHRAFGRTDTIASFEITFVVYIIKYYYYYHYYNIFYIPRPSAAGTRSGGLRAMAGGGKCVR